MENKPIVFVSNFHPFISRNVFDSGALALIALRSQDVYVFVLKHKEEYLKERYEKGNVHIVGLDLEASVNTPKEVHFRRVAELFLNTKTKQLHQKIYLSKHHNYLRYFFASAVMHVCGFFRPIRTLFRAYVLRNIPDSPFDSYFEQYSPSVTLTTDPFSPYDTLFMKSARKTKTTLVAFIRSWDNFTTKEYLQVCPDRVLAQNEETIGEGVVFHDIPKDLFRLVGVPQFEYYKTYTPISREAFCAEMGLDPQKKIILFSPAGDKFSSTDWQICEILKRFNQEKRFIAQVQFLVRLHPMNFTTLTQFTPDGVFVIDNPNVSLKTNSQKESEMDMQNVNHLADSLFHADVVLNTISSLLIDAAIFDKPVVTISFDGWEKNVPFVRSVLAEQSNEWMQVLLKKGLSPKAHTPEELLTLVNAYLADPSIDRDTRTHFVEKHCWKLDGHAPERIAQYTLENL